MKDTNTNNNNNNNYFHDWLCKAFVPCCIVFSTKNAKSVIAKNNLTPSELLRPFGNFTGTNLNFSIPGKEPISLKNFRLDFYDNHNFRKIAPSSLNEILENIMLHPGVYPVCDLLEHSQFSLNELNPSLLRSRNYSTFWYQEIEKAILEFSFFNEYEMFQQPLAYIFICSVKDTLEAIEELHRKESIPLLVFEGVYESKMPFLILIINDRSLKESPSKDSVTKKIEIIKGKYQKAYVLYWDINSKCASLQDDSDEEIWSKYFHTLGIYGIGSSKKKSTSTVTVTGSGSSSYGALISHEERDNFKSSMFKFVNDWIRTFLEKLIEELDEEISNNKKGLGGLFSIFKKNEKIEYIHIFGIYKLTQLEKNMYLLSILQFYLHDYENAMENLLILLSDLKGKSTEHYNSIYELYVLCHFLSANGNTADADIDGPYQAYRKTKNMRSSLRALMVRIKMYEHLQMFPELSKLCLAAASEMNVPYLSQFLFEKVSVYSYLCSPPLTRKYAFYQVLAGIAYKNASLEFKQYTLNCFRTGMTFLKQKGVSFPRLSEFLNSSIGEICLNLEYYECAVAFFSTCIELSTVKDSDQDQALYIRHLLKSLNSLTLRSNSNSNINHALSTENLNLHDLTIPEIDTNSLVVMNEQDYEISKALLVGEPHWKSFEKYSIIPLTNSYIHLTEQDLVALANLDNVIANRQKFEDFRLKKNLKCNVGSKIYCRFSIRNPLNLALSLSSIKLLCDFLPNNCPDNQSPPQFEYEEKSLLLESHSVSDVTVFCIPLYSGRVVIKSIEIGLYKIANMIHNLYDKPSTGLYAYTKKHSRCKEQKSEIQFEVTDIHAQDIQVSFPMGMALTLHLHELLLMPIVIRNNSQATVKSLCLFFQDVKSPSREDDSVKIENNGIMCDYIFREMDIFHGMETEIVVPIVPQKIGNNYIKIIAKFEDVSTLNEIEIKRFIITLHVHPSFHFDFTEELVTIDNEHSSSRVFNLKAKTCISNRDQFTNFKIGNIVTSSNFSIINCRDWKCIDNETNNILYNAIQFKHSHYTISNTTDYEDLFHLSFLNESIKERCPYIVRIFNKLLRSNCLIFPWSCKGKNNEIINGLVFHRCKLSFHMLNIDCIKTIIKHSSSVYITKEIIGEERMISIDWTLNTKGLKAIQEIMCYDIWISDEDGEYTWIGLKKCRIINNTSESDIQRLTFTLMTNKTRVTEINNLNVSLYLKGNERPIVVSSVPWPIFVEM